MSQVRIKSSLSLLMLGLVFVGIGGRAATKWAGSGSVVSSVGVSSEPCQKIGPTTLLNNPNPGAATARHLQNVSIEERLSGRGEVILIFKIKVGSLASLPGYGAIWHVKFRTEGQFGEEFWFVGMYDFGGVYFAYTNHAGKGGAADAESSFDPDGTITIVVPRSGFGFRSGQTLTRFEAETLTDLGEVYEFFERLPETFPSTVSYTLGGTDPCSTPTPSPTPTPVPAPLLLTKEGTERAIALDSLTSMCGPFSPVTSSAFSQDPRTRVMVFARNVELTPGENASSVSAIAEDSQHRPYPLTVEFAGKAPGWDWLTQLNIILPEELGAAGDVWVSITLHGAVRNKVLVSMKTSASGSP
jgi:hypothetical protein